MFRPTSNHILFALIVLSIGAIAAGAGYNVGRDITEQAYAATQRPLDSTTIDGYLHESFDPATPWLAQIRDVRVSPIVDLVTVWAPAEYADEDALLACNAVRGYFRTGAPMPDISVLADGVQVARSMPKYDAGACTLVGAESTSG